MMAPAPFVLFALAVLFVMAAIADVLP